MHIAWQCLEKKTNFVFDFQVIPVAYRSPLPADLTETIPDCLTSIPHAWLLPNLFSCIWTRLRTQPAGDTTGQADWPLKVRLAIS